MLCSRSAIAALPAARIADRAQPVDHYKVLFVSADAPDEVLKAARKALKHPKGSAEAAQADAALALLLDPAKRAEYNGQRARSVKRGGGFDLIGGSDLLRQIGIALGLKFPEGFVFPRTGRLVRAVLVASADRFSKWAAAPGWSTLGAIDTVDASTRWRLHGFGSGLLHRICTLAVSSHCPRALQRRAAAARAFARQARVRELRCWSSYRPAQARPRCQRS